MIPVFINAHSIISPLGFSSEENFESLLNGKTGISSITSPIPTFSKVCCATIDYSILDASVNKLIETRNFTKVERLLLSSIHQILEKAKLESTSEDLLIIISTTKGNIELADKTHLQHIPEERIHLWSLAATLQLHFSTKHTPIVVSNACISGVNALIIASRLLREGSYKQVIVAGVDIVSKFVLSGFQSFMAISGEACKPFDKHRKGINLGEGCGTLLLSTEPLDSHSVKVLGGSTSNDANHISGPSRTGDGLSLAIRKALKESNLEASQLDYINAHGTATLYNDDMESKAFAHLGLSGTSINGLKGYYGHTLGAAGTIETIISLISMQQGKILPTFGFEEHGTAEKIAVSNKLITKKIQYLLKTASGFGGCNAALIVENTNL